MVRGIKPKGNGTGEVSGSGFFLSRWRALVIGTDATRREGALMCVVRFFPLCEGGLTAAPFCREEIRRGTAHYEINIINRLGARSSRFLRHRYRVHDIVSTGTSPSRDGLYTTNGSVRFEKMKLGSLKLRIDCISASRIIVTIYNVVIIPIRLYVDLLYIAEFLFLYK